MYRTGALIAALSVVGWAVTLSVLGWLSSRWRPEAGTRDGRLRPCPRIPACVCSQDEGAFVEPIRFDGDADEAFARVRQVLGSWARTRVVTDEAGYLHAECTSLLFRFVDDLECLLDREARCVHVRSASRVGGYDFGVNRRRIEALRRDFEAAATASR